MLLETGGEARFQMRAIEGVELGPHSERLAELLISDGQQRLTSLTQVLSLNSAVSTRDSKRKEIRLQMLGDGSRRYPFCQMRLVFDELTFVIDSNRAFTKLLDELGTKHIDPWFDPATVRRNF